MQTINDIKPGNIQEALSELNNAKVRIEQQQLSALSMIFNPIFQSARGHLVAPKQSIETGNTDKAVSELYILKQLKLLHQQGMMTMKLPMTSDLNSTFNSAEAHLLSAGEAMNAYDPQRAISELAMFEVMNSLFSNTRTHFHQSVNDTKINDTRAAISELNRVISSATNQVNATTT